MIRIRTPLLAALLLTGTFTFAQEKNTQFDRNTLIAYGIEQIVHVYECVQHQNSCELFDPEGMNDLFTDYAHVQVSSYITHQLISLFPEQYLGHLNYLRCGPRARYRSFLFLYEIRRVAITKVDAGDSSVLTIPVIQRFRGTGNEHSADYNDLTVKQVVFVFRMEGRMPVGKIRDILVESTNPLL